MMKADFSKIISDSIQITKTNRRLWIFGLVLASLGAGANFGSGGNYGDVSKQINKPQNTQFEYSIPNKESNPNLLNSNPLALNLPQVLGTTSSSLTNLLKTIPPSYYVLLVTMIFLAIIVGIAISFYGQSWAQSGLIHGINRQSSGESLGLYQMSDYGKINTGEVIRIRLFPGLIFTLAILATGILFFIPLIILGDAAGIAAPLFGIIWVLAIIVGAIILSGSVGLGIISINLESLKWRQAFRRGFQVFKKYFLDVAILSLINCFAGCVVGIVTLIGIVVLIGIGAASVMGVVAFPPFLVAAGPIIFLALLALIMFTGLITAIFTVFKQSTWVLLYKQLTEETSGQ